MKRQNSKIDVTKQESNNTSKCNGIPRQNMSNWIQPKYQNTMNDDKNLYKEEQINIWKKQSRKIDMNDKNLFKDKTAISDH